MRTDPAVIQPGSLLAEETGGGEDAGDAAAPGGEKGDGRNEADSIVRLLAGGEEPKQRTTASFGNHGGAGAGL